MNALPYLSQVTVFSVVLYLALLALRRLLAGYISASVQYGLWFLLIARLLLPVTFNSRIRLITLPAPPLHTIQPPNPLAMLTPTGLAAWNWGRVLTAAWLAGMAVSLLWLLFVYVRLSRSVSLRGAPPDEAMRAVLEKVNAELGIRRGPKVSIMTGISTPALTAGILPTLLLPSGLALSEDELENVLRHELTHYRRGDAAVCLVLSLLRCVWWFNPVLWLAPRQIKLDMEISCDSLAVRHMSADGRKQYAAMILAMFGNARKPALALGFSADTNRTNIEKRIRGVFMNAKSVKSFLVAAAVAAALLAAACFTTACVPTVAKNPPPATTTAAATPSPTATLAPTAVVSADGTVVWNYQLNGNATGVYTLVGNNSITYTIDGNPSTINVYPQGTGAVITTGTIPGDSLDYTVTYQYTTTVDGETVTIVSNAPVAH